MLGDAGPAGGGGIGGTEMEWTAPQYPTGPSGTNLCDYDAPTTSTTGYHYLCFSANANGGGGLITYGAGGAAGNLPFNIVVNGATIPLGALTPSITVGGTTVLSGTSGQLLYDNAGTLGAYTTLPAAAFPALTGDVTTTAGSLATTIASGAVTGAKMASGAAVANLGFAPKPTPYGVYDSAIITPGSGAVPGDVITPAISGATATTNAQPPISKK